MTREEFNTAFRKLKDYAQAVDFILCNVSNEEADLYWVQHELNRAKSESEALLKTINKIISLTFASSNEIGTFFSLNESVNRIFFCSFA